MTWAAAGQEVPPESLPVTGSRGQRASRPASGPLQASLQYSPETNDGGLGLLSSETYEKRSEQVSSAL